MPDLEHEPEPVSVEGGYQAYLDLGPTPPQALYPGGYKSIDATQKVIRNDDAQELGCAPEVSVASDHARPLKVDRGPVHLWHGRLALPDPYQKHRRPRSSSWPRNTENPRRPWLH